MQQDKITDLPELSTAAADDLLEVTDVSTGSSNRIQTQNLAPGVVQGLPNVSIAPRKLSPSAMVARINGFSSGSLISNYAIEEDDGNFASGVWTSPYPCIATVSLSVSFRNQSNTSSGGRIEFSIEKNSTTYIRLWGTGRPGNSVDDIAAAGSIDIPMSTGDTIRVVNLIVDNAGSLYSPESRLSIRINSGDS